MKKAFRFIYILFSVAIIGICLYGIYSFFTVPSKAIESQKEIENMIRENQEESEKLKEKQKELSGAYDNNNEALYNLYENAAQMHITAIGDSVMVSALPELQAEFPNSYFDAKFGRTIYEGIEVLKKLEAENSIGEAVIFSLGANSYIQEEDCEELIKHCNGKPTFWITTYGVTNDSNEKMTAVVARHDNAFMIDWETLAMQHPGWILSDHLHPNREGSAAYADLLNEVITEKLLRPVEASGDEKGC